MFLIPVFAFLLYIPTNLCTEWTVQYTMDIALNYNVNLIENEGVFGMYLIFVLVISWLMGLQNGYNTPTTPSSLPSKGQTHNKRFIALLEQYRRKNGENRLKIM